MIQYHATNFRVQLSCKNEEAKAGVNRNLLSGFSRKLVKLKSRRIQDSERAVASELRGD
jgi:hypothetical protein